MALCRCDEKQHKPKGTKEEYINYVKPIGYPETSSFCGRKNCNKPGLIWMTKEDYDKYLKGQTLFTYASSDSKVKDPKAHY